LNHGISALKPLRVGVIGVGRIVERAHLPILTEIPDVTVAGLFDQDSARARAIAARFDLPAAICHSPTELFDLDLDITLVACPNYLHAEMSIAALEARTHVLCEKPMATTVTEAEGMIEAVDRTGKELMVAFANRFRPEVKAVRSAIQQGQLGEIKSIRCGWLRRRGVPGVGTWFTSLAQSGGGVLTDLGSHLIDMVIWFCGRRKLLDLSCILDRVIGTHAQAAWYLPDEPDIKSPFDVEISANAFAIFDGQLDMFIEVSWACATPHDQTYFQVIGTRGIARLETLFGFSPDGYRPQTPLKLWIDGQPAGQPITASEDLLQPYRDQWAFFLENVCNGQSLRPALDDDLATAHLVEVLYDAAKKTESAASAKSGRSDLNEYAEAERFRR
jgi:predicted dehydrogenase